MAIFEKDAAMGDEVDLVFYQDFVKDMSFYPDAGKGINLQYPTLGLAGEAGECANYVKKIYRDRDGVISDDDRVNLTKELGDVLFYVSALATELNVEIKDIFIHNYQKLLDRHERNKLGGSGDNR